MNEQDYRDYLMKSYLESRFGNNTGCFPVVAACLIGLLFLLASCRSVQYVPVETVRTEYINRTDTVEKVDSFWNEKIVTVIEADSSLAAEYGLKLDQQKKAYFILQKELEKAKSEKYEARTDTVFRDKEVQVPYPVEKQLTKWQQICLDYGKLMMGGTIVAIILAVLWLLRWLRYKDL